MLEIPESTTIAFQANNILTGKIISQVINASSPHKFAWYSGNPEEYGKILTGKQIQGFRGHGAFIDILCDDEVTISISDGTDIKYYPSFESHPKKHQLLLVFDDNSFIAFTVSMYGSILAYKGELENMYHQGSLQKISPLEDEWDKNYFENLFRKAKPNLSVKAFLATQQRIPGLGNGVLQDILFNASLNPKRKLSTITDLEKEDLFHSLEVTLEEMTEKGGRDTERDFFGNYGRYKTILSKKTYKEPCINCGGEIIKEAYLGGSVYFCTTCQKPE